MDQEKVTCTNFLNLTLLSKLFLKYMKCSNDIFFPYTVEGKQLKPVPCGDRASQQEIKEVPNVPSAI